MKQLTDEQAFAQVVKVLKESFDGGTEFELFKEGPGVYRVKARAERNGVLTAGIKKLKTELHSDVDPGGIAIKMLDEDAAQSYRKLAAETSDAILKAGYLALADDAAGQ